VTSLADLVRAFAAGIAEVDAGGPTAVNQRSGVAFQPGIGPHTEANTVKLVMGCLAASKPDEYGQFSLGVRYSDGSRQACDLCLGQGPEWQWAVEVKMLRLMGDNGKPNDNILMHILSPYPEHRSALTDCRKLQSSGLGDHQAVMIFGYDYDGWPMEPAIEAFEALAGRWVSLGSRQHAAFEGLVHPIHRRGGVFAWELQHL
jgi:hypothetical protein